MRASGLLLVVLSLGWFGCPAEDVGPPKVIASIAGPPRAELLVQGVKARNAEDPYAVLRHPQRAVQLRVASVPPIDEQIAYGSKEQIPLTGWQLRASPNEWIAHRGPRDDGWVVRWVSLHGCRSTAATLDDAHRPTLESAADQLIDCAPELVFQLPPSTATRLLKLTRARPFGHEPKPAFVDGAWRFDDGWLDALDKLGPPVRDEVQKDLLACFESCPRDNDSYLVAFLDRAAALADWTRPETGKAAADWAGLANDAGDDQPVFARLYRGAARLDAARAAEVACKLLDVVVENRKGVTDPDGGAVPLPAWTAAGFEAIARARLRCPATLPLLAGFPCDAAYGCKGGKVCTAHELTAEVDADLAQPDAPRAWAPTKLSPLRAALAAALSAGQKPTVRTHCTR